MSGGAAAGVGTGLSLWIGASCETKNPDDVGVRSAVMSVPFRLAEGGVVSLAEGDVHGLLVGVEVDRAVAPLVAEPRGLDPAERRAQVAHVVRVEPDHAGFDRL